MTEQVAIRFHISTLQLKLAVLDATEAFNKLQAIFADREWWWASCEGQWPDKFVLLNRYVRTGLRPPFILND